MTTNKENSAGYRMTELGPLPEEWRVVRLGDLWDQGALWIKNGFPQGGFNEQGRGVPHLRPFNVNERGEISLHQIKYVPPPPDNSPYWLRKGDIIFNNTNSEELVGKVAYFDYEGKFVLSNHMTIVRVQDPHVLNDVWLAWWLLHLWHQGFTQTLARRHVNQASISLARLRSIPIPLPPLPEQRAIAHVLRVVQEAKEATERVITATRELKKSLMRHLFTYGPVPLGATHASPLQNTEIGPIPAHWRVVRLGEVADFKNGINFKREDRGKGILTIDVFNMYTDDVYPRLSGLYRVNITVRPDYLLAPGDLLFVRSSLKREGVGWTAIFPGYHEPVTFCGFLIRGRLHSKDILPEFIVHFLRFPPVRGLMVSKSGKVAITNINQGNLKVIPIPVPPLSEQREIARMLQAVDEKIRAEEARKAALEGLFKSLLHHLMTAKVRLPKEFIQKFQEGVSYESFAFQEG